MQLTAELRLELNGKYILDYSYTKYFDNVTDYTTA